MSGRRIGPGLVLAAWGALFWWLLATGRSSLYLSTRTAWLVPVGAVLLTLAAAGRLIAAPRAEPEDLAPRELWRFVVLLVPVIAVAAIPPASLGSFAVEKRSSFAAANFSTSPQEIAAGELTLVDLAGAQQSAEGMKALVARAGTEVDFTGFVVRDATMPADEFQLTRFIIACCVADALSVQVRVVGVVPGRFARDDWVRVTGRLYPVGSEILVQADRIEPLTRPEDPYITP